MPAKIGSIYWLTGTWIKNQIELQDLPLNDGTPEVPWRNFMVQVHSIGNGYPDQPLTPVIDALRMSRMQFGFFKETLFHLSFSAERASDQNDQTHEKDLDKIADIMRPVLVQVHERITKAQNDHQATNFSIMHQNRIVDFDYEESLLQQDMIEEISEEEYIFSRLDEVEDILPAIEEMNGENIDLSEIVIAPKEPN